MFVTTEDLPAAENLIHDDHQQQIQADIRLNVSNVSSSNNKGDLESGVFRKQSTGNDSVHSMHSHTSSHHSQHSSNINDHHSSSSSTGQQSFRRSRKHERRHRQNPPRLQNSINMNHQMLMHTRQGIQNRNNANSPTVSKAVHDSHNFLQQIGQAKSLSRYGSQIGSGPDLDPDSNVYVANLPCNFGEEKLRKLFNSYGQIVRLKFVTPDEQSQPGYGFVQFQHKNDAHRAIQSLESYTFESGESIYLSIALRRRSSLSDEPTNLYVKQLPPSWDQNMLHQVFGRYGVIRQSKVVGDGIAFVRYDAHEQALNAISNLDKSDQGNGHFLEVKFATRKTAANAYRLQQIPPQNQQNSNNLYVRNLPKVDFGQTCLENLFVTYGKISSAKSNDNGSAFVRFANANDAQKAINALNGSKPDHRFHEELMVKLAHFDIGDSRNRWKNDSNGGGGGGGQHKAFNNHMYKTHFNAPTMSTNFNAYAANGYANNEMNMQSNVGQQPTTNQLLAHINHNQNIFNMNAMKSMSNITNGIPQLQQQMSQWQIAGNGNQMLMNNMQQQIPGQTTNQGTQNQQNLIMLSLGNPIQMPVMYNVNTYQNQNTTNDVIHNESNSMMFTEKQQQMGNILFQRVSTQSQYSNWATKITGMILRMGDNAAQMCINDENELKKQIQNAVSMLKEENAINSSSVGVNAGNSALKNRMSIAPLNVNIHTLNSLQNMQNARPQSSGTPVDIANNALFNVYPTVPHSLPNTSAGGNVAGMSAMMNNMSTATAMANLSMLNNTLCISPLGTPKGGIGNNPLLMPVLRGTSPIIDIRSLNSSPMAPTNHAISSGWAMAANVGLMNNGFNTSALNNSLNALTNMNMNLNTISNLNMVNIAGNGNGTQLGGQSVVGGSTNSMGVNANANQMKQIFVQPNVQYLGSQNMSHM